MKINVFHVVQTSPSQLWPQEIVKHVDVRFPSVTLYIHNVTKVMCALYVRCTLSVLQKECRKVWGARYWSDNTVLLFAIQFQASILCGVVALEVLELYFGVILLE